MEESVEALRRLAEHCVNSRGNLNIQDTTNKGLLLLLQLKEESRKLAFSAEDQREETSKSKTRLEQAHLQLQNLLYEKEYYEKEIQECQNFRFKHPDSAIGLVPVEQFLANADPETLARIGDDSHTLMLERLRDELTQRKAMVAKLEELRKAKAATRQEVDKRKRTLDDLRQQLQGLEASARPLQNILAPHLALRSVARNADLLPLPLYIIYSQLASVREALDLPIRVSISGAQVEAESFAKAQMSDPADAAAEGAAGGAAAGPVSAVEPAAKQARLSPAPPLLLGTQPGGGASRSTPPGAVGAAASSDDLYQTHPLYVSLAVLHEVTKQAVITVRFQYLVSLKLVTAVCESSAADSALLAALFPGDDGSAAAYEYLAQLQGGTFKYDTSRAAKPYRWCQLLAGLDFAPPLPLATQLQGGAGQGQGQPDAAAGVMEGLESYRRQQRVIHVIERLRAVKAGDEALKRILAALDKTPNPPNLARYPKLPATAIVTVEEVKAASPAAGGATASGAGKGKESVARGATPSSRAAAVAVAGGGQQQQQQQQPAAAVPAHLRAEAAAAGGDEGEVGRRGGRPTTAMQEGTSSPAPADGGAQGSAAGPSAATANGPVAAAAARAAAGSQGDEVMEDGEAAEEGEAHGAHEDGEDGEDGRPDGDAAAADDLIARYLLSDILAAEGGAAAGGGGADGRPPLPAAPKPVSRLYRIVLRLKALECEVLARVFLEYPLRPPLLRVKAVREVVRRGQARPVEDVNLVAWLESEANSVALSCVPPDATNDTLLYQLLHLRLAFDEFASVYLAASASAAAAGAAGTSGAGAGGEDLMALLAAKQRMRGRDRRVVLPVLPEAAQQRTS